MSIRVMTAERPTGTKWRRRAFDSLVARDGEACSECREPGRTVWRHIGYGCGEQWGEDPWETYRFNRVHPCSSLEVDHKTPLSEGGTNDLENLWLLCGDCHKQKTSGERSARLKRIFAEWREAQQ